MATAHAHAKAEPAVTAQPRAAAPTRVREAPLREAEAPTTRERMEAAFGGSSEWTTRERIRSRARAEEPEPQAPEPEPDETTAEPEPTAPRLTLVPPLEDEREGYAPTQTVEPIARGPPLAAVVQTKLTVSSPGDPLEREADLVAARVLGGVPTRPRPPRAAAPIRGPPDLPRSVASVVTAPGGGRPLDAAIRERIEPHLGIDLGDVRVRQGPDAAAAARDLHARAFTSGSTIFLAAGSSAADLGLMAHEATHVAQQRTAPAARTTLMRDVTDVLPDISVGDVIPDWILDGVRDTVRAIPGYIVLTYIAGRDPLSDEPAPASPQEVIEALLTRGPFGAAVGGVLQTIDVLGEVFDFVMAGLSEHGLTLARIERDIDAAWSELSVTNGIAGNVAIVERYVDALLNDVTAFVDSIVERVLEIVRAVVSDVVEPLLETDAIAPLWNLVKKVLHYDPLRGVAVDAPTAEIIADFLRLIGEEERLAQMQERGTLPATADWLDTQLGTFASLVTELGALFDDARAAIQPQNLPDLLTNLEALAWRAFGFIQGVGLFAGTLILKVLELVKESLLGWLSENAHSVPGFRLLTVIIGQNPFTGEEVPRTAENLIKGFITLLPGGEATYEQLAESGVISSAAERIEGEMGRLGITLELITGTFRGIWDTLTLDDLLAPLDAFARILAQFGEPLARLVEFAAVVIEVVVTLILRLMNFPTELLGSVISNTLAAIDDIRRDPVAFLLNMVEAIKLGFTAFFDKIGQYLLDGLVAWLFRGLGQLGITLPADFSLPSILTLVFQVLGLTIEHLWEKLGEHIGPERVAMIRGALDKLSGAWAFIQDVQREGLPAIWRYVKDQLSGIWTTLLTMATEWIMQAIIVNATVKLLSFIDPSGIMATINTCIAIFNAIMSAIEYIRDMLEVFNQYVMTLAAVAAGNIVPGAQMLEMGLAAIIPIAIGFLAKQVGIGNIPEKIAELIGRLREIVDQAIDWLIEQALRLGQAALNALGLGGGAEEEASPAAPSETRDVEQPFVFGEERHEITGHLDGTRLRITIASNGETDFWDKVDTIEFNHARFWSRSRDPATQAKGQLLQQRIDALRQDEQALLAMHAAETDPDERYRIAQDGITGLRLQLSDIADEFGLHGMGLHFEPPLHVFQDYSADRWGRGRRADGAPISSQSRGQGTPATGQYIPGIDLRSKQERGHLVANRLGGLGDEPKHLTPLDKATNTAMRDGPEAEAARFIYEGDPSQSLHYYAVAEYRDVGDFQAWLQTYLAVPVLPNAGDRMWTALGTANPTPLEMDVAVGLALTPAQHAQILRGLAFYFLCYQVYITIANVNAAPGNMIQIPLSQPVAHPVAVP